MPQVLLNMIDHGMDPQSALDSARFCIRPDSTDSSIHIEEGILLDSIRELRELGHRVVGPVRGFERVLFGRGQIVCSRPVGGGGGGRERVNVWWAGSDGRGDGVPVGY